MAYHCVLRQMGPQLTMSVRREVPARDAGSAVVDAFGEVGRYLKEVGGRPVGDTFARFRRIDDEVVDVEVGFTVLEALPPAGPVQASELPAGEAITTTHQGPYERLPEAVAALEEWVRGHERTVAGPFWEVYLNGPPDVTEPEAYETEVVMPLAPVAHGHH